MRSTDEWIGATDDAAIPQRVRLRVFQRHNGICHISRRKIRSGEAWELEHVVALCLGGKHRESNLAPALKASHKVKTAANRKMKAKDDRVRKRHIGIRKDRTIRAWRSFSGEIIYAGRKR